VEGVGRQSISGGYVALQDGAFLCIIPLDSSQVKVKGKLMSVW